MSVRGRVQSVAEDHRVTTFELFFDLVFVFAVTYCIDISNTCSIYD
jgi:low temperature requirement protein LtrA